MAVLRTVFDAGTGAMVTTAISLSFILHANTKSMVTGCELLLLSWLLNFADKFSFPSSCASLTGDQSCETHSLTQACKRGPTYTFPASGAPNDPHQVLFDASIARPNFAENWQKMPYGILRLRPIKVAK